MNKKYIARLTDEEREYLNGLVKKGKTAAYKIRYANMLLKADTDAAGSGQLHEIYAAASTFA